MKIDCQICKIYFIRYIVVAFFIATSGCLTTNVTHVGTVEFVGETFDLTESSRIKTIYRNLNRENRYELRGYSCMEASDSEESRLNEANKRSQMVSDQLVEIGFPKSHLSTISFDKSPICKVEIHIIK